MDETDDRTPPPDIPTDIPTGIPPGIPPGIDERQRRELEYHREFAARHRDKIETPVALDVIAPGPRRRWNAYWSSYDALMAQGVAGKKVLVPGCGFGEDAIRLAALGAEVFAADLSPDLIAIAHARAERMGIAGIHFEVMPAEQMTYDDDRFDLVYFNDILHHVDIPRTLAEVRRVLRPGGSVVANELYTHSLSQKIRDSRLIAGVLYRRMVPFIYGTKTPYITEDERKIDERELAMIAAILRAPRYEYFLLIGGRLVPPYWPRVGKFDHAALNAFRPLGRLLAGRVVVVGTVRK
jgi:ubiquinone/menaquinone biosynthesis C-methylase UbiE